MRTLAEPQGTAMSRTMGTLRKIVVTAVALLTLTPLMVVGVPNGVALAHQHTAYDREWQYATNVCGGDETCVRGHMAHIDELLEQARAACGSDESCLRHAYAEIFHEPDPVGPPAPPAPPRQSPPPSDSARCELNPVDPACDTSDPGVEQFRKVWGRGVNVSFNGTPMQPGVAPYDARAFIHKQFGKSYLPVRAILQAMGMRLGFDGETQEIVGTGVIKGKNTEVRLKVGSTNATVNGKTVNLGSEPIIILNRTLVPLRPLIESLGGSVTWNGDTDTAYVDVNDGAFTPLLPYNLADAQHLGYKVQRTQERVNVPSISYIVTPLGEKLFYFRSKLEIEQNTAQPLIGPRWRLVSCISDRIDKYAAPDGSIWLYLPPNSEQSARVIMGSGQRGYFDVTKGQCDDEARRSFFELAEQLKKLLDLVPKK